MQTRSSKEEPFGQNGKSSSRYASTRSNGEPAQRTSSTQAHSTGVFNSPKNYLLPMQGQPSSNAVNWSSIPHEAESIVTGETLNYDPFNEEVLAMTYTKIIEMYSDLREHFASTSEATARAFAKFLDGVTSEEDLLKHPHDILLIIEKAVQFLCGMQCTSDGISSAQSDYEALLQKAEADLRKHIRNEQQLKLIIESTQMKLEDAERNHAQVFAQYEAEREEMRRENNKLSEELRRRERDLEEKADRIARLEAQTTSFAEGKQNTLDSLFCNRFPMITPENNRFSLVESKERILCTEEDSDKRHSCVGSLTKSDAKKPPLVGSEEIPASARLGRQIPPGKTPYQNSKIDLTGGHSELRRSASKEGFYVSKLVDCKGTTSTLKQQPQGSSRMSDSSSRLSRSIKEGNNSIERGGQTVRSSSGKRLSAVESLAKLSRPRGDSTSGVLQQTNLNRSNIPTNRQPEKGSFVSLFHSLVSCCLEEKEG
eukprot:TRINITY_DN2995_c0_g1_i6.p1 TRINITY_DN2995_c0_g1~~TRINITY_DN2995_c0_g1_i6.p1  ORF type:complete len:483 (+),score=92.30 TRINITY_DN2995_c0_g1_i6:130-1578(+)